MDKTHYERRSHEQGNYEITPTYQGQVVATIKSLATGQTMKVYLDEPTQSVDGFGDHTINFTSYTGYFDEEEFLITSDGFEITGLPLMYPYWNGPSADDNTRVINTENHYYSEKPTNSITDSVNLASFPIDIDLVDSQDPINTGGNRVRYRFTRSGGTSPTPGGKVKDGINYTNETST